MTTSLIARLHSLASFSRTRARFALSAALLAAALLAAGCGSSSGPSTSTNSATTSTSSTLDTAPVVSAIEKSIRNQHRIATVASCPSGIPLKTGYHFTCVAALDAGRYPLHVVEVNAKGGVTYSNHSPLRLLRSSGIVIAIQTAIRRQQHSSSTVTCPATILQAKGLVFACTARTKRAGRTRTETFTVTEIDNKAHVTFVGHF